MDELMKYIDDLMMDADINPFSYDTVTGSRVLSGEEEAVFDWISVNYLLGNFAGKPVIIIIIIITGVLEIIIIINNSTQ